MPAYMELAGNAKPGEVDELRHHFINKIVQYRGRNVITYFFRMASERTRGSSDVHIRFGHGWFYVTREDASSVPMWAQIISKYSPTFLGECQKSVDVSRSMVNQWLSENMLQNNSKKAEEIANWLSNHASSAMHDRHISMSTAQEHGLKIKVLEEDNSLQDLILSIHHSYMMSFEFSTATLIMENSNNNSWIRFVQQNQC